jgi:hypothetical protein
MEELLMAKNNVVSIGVTTMVRGFVLCLLLVVAVFAACAQESDMILELKDVQFFKIRQTNSSPMTLRVSGLSFHSALAVQKVTISEEHDSMRLFVHLTPATQGLSGNFDYTVTIPDSINLLSFGKERSVIWRRDVGIVEHK